MNRFANLLSPSSPKAGGAEKDSASAMGGTASKLKCHGSQPRAPPGTSLGKRHEGSSPGGLHSVRSWQDNLLQGPSGRPTSYYNNAVHASGADSYRGNPAKSSRSMGNQDGGPARFSLGASSNRSGGCNSGRGTDRKQQRASPSPSKPTLAQLMGSLSRTKELEPQQVAKASPAQEAFGEEILDEGAMLPSHGVSPPRRSILSSANNLQ